MPRGGGGFGGGGFGGGRGGGFGGGGFRGGGFRGGSPGFRSGPSGSHPFGRTGANRNISRGPRGNNYYGRHYGGRGWYGGWGWGGYGPWYRPWYARGYWWWGRPFGAWYYSPVYIGGGFILFLLLMLLVIPLIGLAVIPYPATNSQTVTYSDTQTLNFNEYWYESEYLSAGNQISYQVQSQVPISFAISTQPFSSFPIAHSGNTGTESYSFNVNPNEDYQYVTYYLYQGDTLNYNYTTSSSIEFFIADGPNLQSWNNYESAQLFKDAVVSGPQSGSFSAPHSQDWYLVWYNSATSGSAITVSTTINYSISSVDMSNANVHVLNTVDITPNTYTVPTSGTYYFYIYFDPTASSASQTDISFNVVYHKDLNSTDSWKQASPLLSFLVIIIGVLLIVAFVQRRNAKQYEKNKKQQANNQSAQASGVSTTQTSTTTGSTTQVLQVPSPSTTESGGKKRCHVCGNAYFDTDVYCPNCGTKLMGRDYGVSTQSTPSGSQTCAVCGTYLQQGARFCPDCGTQVK